MFKKEIVLHTLSTVSVFAIITLLKGGFTNFSYVYFWIGGMIGMILPDIDHLIYVFYLNPTDLNSQRIRKHISERSYLKGLEVAYASATERTKLIFHSVLFQITFVVFTVLVFTSSASMFGRGIVLSFSLHLIIDQLQDLMSARGIQSWFRDLPINLKREHAMFYWISIVLIISFIGVYF